MILPPLRVAMWEHSGPPNFDIPPDRMASSRAFVIEQLADMMESKSTVTPTTQPWQKQTA